jgi:hypothetical protein
MTGSSTGSAGRAGRGPGASRAARRSRACCTDAAPLLELLIGLGHRQLFYIAGTASGYHDAHRYAFVKAGLPAESILRFQGDYTFESGVSAAPLPLYS